MSMWASRSANCFWVYRSAALIFESSVCPSSAMKNSFHARFSRSCTRKCKSSCIIDHVLLESAQSDSKPGKTTREKVSEVDALLSLMPDIGPVRACRRVGIPKETYYWHKRKEKSPPVPGIPVETDRAGEMATLAGGSQSIPAPDGAGGPDSVEEI